MLLGWNHFTPFRVIFFLVLFVIVNIIVFMTFFSSNELIPPPKNQHAGKYILGTKLSMIQFSCSRWLLEVFIGTKTILCGESVPLEKLPSEPPSVKFSRAKDVSVIITLDYVVYIINDYMYEFLLAYETVLL